MTDVQIDDHNLGDVSGKVAIVTGGASGIGEALVKLLHSKSSTVVFCDVNSSAGEHIAESLGPNADFIKCDVLVWKELRGVFTHAKERYGHVDMVFANAGVGTGLDYFDDKMDEEGELMEMGIPVIDVNLKSVAATSKLALHYFKKNDPPGGSLVLTCSTAGYNARPNIVMYSASKHGVAGLLRALALFVTPESGITVNAVAPGGTATAMFNEKAQAAAKSLGVPVQSADYVAKAGVYLATKRDWNGKCLTLIGGRATEVEEALEATRPQWYGKYNTEMAAKATGINYKDALK